MPTKPHPWGPTGKPSRKKRRGKSSVSIFETNRRGRKYGSKNKNPRKDKGIAKGRKAKDGEKVGELRKSITKYKKHIGLGATPKTKPTMMAFMNKHNIPIGY